MANRQNGNKFWRGLEKLMASDGTADISLSNGFGLQFPPVYADISWRWN
jgi:hypothetical protein